MATGPSYRVAFRRRREGKTDYQQRRSLVASGLPRLVIRGSLKNISMQLIKAEMGGDRVIVSAHSNEVAKKYGWQGGGGSLPVAYLTGLLVGYKATANGVKEAVLDLGLNAPSKGSRVFAALKGALDSGVVIPHGESKMPDGKRIQGVHVTEYAKKLSPSQDIYQRQFSEQLSRGLRPEELTEHFLQVKQKISSSFQKIDVSTEKEEKKKSPEAIPETKKTSRKEKKASAKKTAKKPRVRKREEQEKSEEKK
jgi:large subunit ribosomal protein L18